MYSCFCITKNPFLKNLCSGTHRGGFQFFLILDLLGISFHAVVVFGLGKNLLFKSILGHCAMIRLPEPRQNSTVLPKSSQPVYCL